MVARPSTEIGKRRSLRMLQATPTVVVIQAGGSSLVIVLPAFVQLPFCSVQRRDVLGICVPSRRLPSPGIESFVTLRRELFRDLRPQRPGVRQHVTLVELQEGVEL